MVLLIIFGILTYLITGFIIADWVSARTEDGSLHWSWFVSIMLLWQLVISLMSVLVVLALFYGLGMWVYRKLKKKNKNTTEAETKVEDVDMTSAE